MSHIGLYICIPSAHNTIGKNKKFAWIAQFINAQFHESHEVERINM